MNGNSAHSALAPEKAIKREFDERGYVVIRGFLDLEAVAAIRGEIRRIATEAIETLPPESVYYENPDDTSSLKQIQKLHEADAYFGAFGRSRTVVRLAECLLDGPVELQNLQYFNKAAGSGAPTPPHQDGYYFMIRPQNALTMWLSLGHADAENGAVRYIPFSHTKGVRPHADSSVVGFSQVIEDWGEPDVRAEEQMQAGPGDLLVHHAMTVHSAPGNASARDRQSIGLIFYGGNVEVDTEAHAAYQERLAARLRETGKLRDANQTA